MRESTRDILAVGGIAALALGAVALMAHAVSASTPSPSAPQGGTTPSGGTTPPNNVKPSVDPWGDLKTQIQLLNLAASNLRADIGVNIPSVWSVYNDSFDVANDAQNLLTNPDGSATKPPAPQGALTQLDADASQLFNDAAAAGISAIVPPSTKLLVGAVAAAALGVTRAAFTAGV